MSYAQLINGVLDIAMGRCGMVIGESVPVQTVHNNGIRMNKKIRVSILFNEPVVNGEIAPTPSNFQGPARSNPDVSSIKEDGS